MPPEKTSKSLNARKVAEPEKTNQMLTDREIWNALRAKGLKPCPSKGGKKKRKKVSRVGKMNIVRLRGKDLEKLRQQCFVRDAFLCRDCGRRVAWSSEISTFADGDMAWSNSLGIQVGHMAHIRTKRNNGDTLENVRTLCADCHQREHNAGGKPVPKK